MQSGRDLIQGDLGKFRDGTNRNFKKFSKKYQVFHLGLIHLCAFFEVLLKDRWFLLKIHLLTSHR